MKNQNKPLSIILLGIVFCLCLSLCAFAAGSEATATSEAPADAVTEAIVEEKASELIVDLDDAENPDELAAMIDKGYITYYSDGSFRPGRSYTRLELAQLVTAMCSLKEQPDALPAFYDTEIFGEEAILAAVSNGLMTGRSDTSFDPYGNVLKAELISTLEKAAALLSIENFDELIAAESDWSRDYTICSAAEAMHFAYILDTAVTDARDAALKEAAALLASLTGNQGSAVEFDLEPAEEGNAAEDAAEDLPDEAEAEIADDAAETSEDNSEESESAAEEVETAAEETDTQNTEASEEPAADESQSASSEAAVPSEEMAEAAEPSTAAVTEKPAGVTTPADSQVAAAQTPTSPTQPAETEEAEEPAEGEQLIIQQVVEIYNDIRSSIVEFFRGLFG